MLRSLVKLGFHGARHRLSQHYINVVKYSKWLEKKHAELEKWMHNNGLGA